MEKKKRLYLKFKMDEVSDSGEFTGHASIFGNVDSYQEIVKKGAFKKTLRESKGKIPILDHHSPVQQIGWNLEAREDERGLFVRGQLNLEVQAAREKHALMKQAFEIDARTGLSIGFRTIKWENDKDDPHVRILTEVQLLEYSIVAFAANTEAAVEGVKAQGDLVQLFLENEIGMEQKPAAQAVDFIKSLLDEEEPVLASRRPGEPGDHSNAEEADIKQSLNGLLRTFQNTLRSD